MSGQRHDEELTWRATIIHQTRGVWLAELTYLPYPDPDYDAFPSLGKAKEWAEWIAGTRLRWRERKRGCWQGTA